MPAKRALLISSPYGQLKGPPNDIKRMETMLDGFGFKMTKCDGQNATRQGILDALQQLIENTCSGDTVVIYYSGHGGMVEAIPSLDESITDPGLSKPWRYQFLVPIDFDQTTSGQFRGILSLELSYLLRSLTDKTQNVTAILDCCHAGRMARDPAHGDAAVPRAVPLCRFDEILEHIERLRTRGALQQDTHVDDNPHVVRIAASAPDETAWEYRNADGDWCGAMTVALERVLLESKGTMTDWQTAMLRVAEAVNTQFRQQHPRVEGPGDRLHFSIQTRPHADGTFHIRNEIDTGDVVIQAGYVSRIHERDLYAVVPFGNDGGEGHPVAEARVTEVSAFKAIVELRPLEGHEAYLLPDEGALAVLRQHDLPEWPVTVPPGLPWLESDISKSRFVRVATVKDKGLVLAEFRQVSDRLSLHTKSGVELLATSDSSNRFAKGEPHYLEAVTQLARAQYLLAKQSPPAHEALEHSSKIDFGIVSEQGVPKRIIGKDGNDYVTEGDRVYIRLQNTGVETLHAWVFDVNVAGRIGVLSGSSPTGFELPPGRFEVIGTNKEGRLRGQKVKWPKNLPRTQPIEETLLFVLTSAPVNLRHLDSSRPPLTDIKRGRVSGLEEFTYQIWHSKSRIIVADDEDATRYAMVLLPFLLRPTNEDQRE